MNKIFL